jgi:hypothetical protein
MAYDLVWRTRTAGGIDPGEDVHPLLSAIAGTLGSSSDWDIAHATYVFDYLSGEDKDSRTTGLAQKLATEYAQRFAEWLGYVFLDRANLTHRTAVMKGLEEGLGKWVEAIPTMLGHGASSPSAFIPPKAGQYFREDRLDALGNKILRVVEADWVRSEKQASESVEMPINWNPEKKLYEIPKSRLTYDNRNKLKMLGFSYSGEAWTTPTLDTHALQELGLHAKVEKVPVQHAVPKGDPAEWFFEHWLPKNIDRFSKAFNEYGKAEGVAYSFKFQISGRNVNVVFTRDIKTIEGSIKELEDRYGGGDREGWITAIECYRKLKASSGKSAIHAIDMANNLEHSHGAMIEHFPPGIRSWYPKFLDFKYTAHAWQMIKAIHEEDLRTVASELMPLQQRIERLAPPPRDHRTPKGLALEISAQPGKPAKKKLLKETLAQYPEMADQILALLRERGLELT